MQKLVRAAFGNNNVDTCARVCHSPTGYGLKTTYGTSAGTQDFDSVDEADVIMIIGANPTDGHPVFASRMKKRLREGAKLIILDPRRIDLVRTPHIEADYHLPLKPGTNVAVRHRAGACDRDRGAGRTRNSCASAATGTSSRIGRASSPTSGIARKWSRRSPACRPSSIRGAARLYATGGNGAIYYGLGVTEHSQGSTTVMAIANLAMATGNIGREGVGVNPLRGQNNVQGSCDMGSFPHEVSGYRHVSEDATRAMFETLWGRPLDAEPGLRIPNMIDAAVDGSFKGLYIQGEDILQSDPEHPAHGGRPRRDGMRRGAGPVPGRDGELRACVPAGLDLPGEERHLHQCRAPHPDGAQGDGADGTATRTGRSPSCCPTRSAIRCTTTTHPRSWTRSRR